MERQLHVERLERNILMRLAEIRDGRDGERGPQGEPGVGERGPQGEPGPIGPEGKEGRGLPGLKGDPGPPGKDGESIVGPAGPAGPPGKDGETVVGAKGDPGPPGESITGPQGPAGPAGKDGESIVGSKGDVGPIGPKGDPGERGAEGPPGKLPLVKEWVDGAVHYQGDVVVHSTGTFQARCDTARAVDSTDWICLARSGRSLTLRGTYDPKENYAELDVVTRNATWYAAKKDAPGECPGPDWKSGPAGKTGNEGQRGHTGEQGPRGHKGEPGDTIIDWRIDRKQYVATPVMASGVDGPPLNMRLLFEQFETEIR